MKILLVSDDKRAQERLRNALGAHAAESDIIAADTQVLMRPEELIATPADLVIIEGLGRDTAAWVALERVTARRPQLPIVVATSQQSAEMMQLAMRSGVREVVALEEAALGEMLQRMSVRIAAANGRPTGKVLAFVPAKGSGGATFIATSLAYSLSSRSGKRVLLIDLNLECGDASLFVSDKEPEFTLADVCRQIQRLDASFLAACTVTPYAGFSVLAAPGDPEAAMQVKPEHIDVILGVAVENYDYVIFDVDRVMVATSVRALDASDQIFTVVQETLPSLRDAKRLFKNFSSLGYPKEKLRLVVNRHHKGLDISLDDVEKTLEMPVKVSLVIPNSYHSVAGSINQGIPLAILVPHDPVVHAIDAIAEAVGGKPAQADGIINRLLHT